MDMSTKLRCVWVHMDMSSVLKYQVNFSASGKNRMCTGGAHVRGLNTSVLIRPSSHDATQQWAGQS